MEDAYSILQQYFGYETFRPGQEKLIQGILQGRDVVGIYPPVGKSLCYQIPALSLPGLTLVISPLISLMKDQVDGLRELGISAAKIDGQTEPVTYRDIMRNAFRGDLKLLYIAPERLAQESFQRAVKNLPIALVAIDEAHCVSQWGHDFRPSYRQIAAGLADLTPRPIFAALTATATEPVQADIVKGLALQDPLVYVADFDRPNLYFNILAPSDRKNAPVFFGGWSECHCLLRHPQNSGRLERLLERSRCDSGRLPCRPFSRRAGKAPRRLY